MKEKEEQLKKQQKGGGSNDDDDNDKGSTIWKKDTDSTSLSGHTDVVRSVCISNDDTTIVSGSDDNTIRIWGIDGTLIRTLSGHTNGVYSVCISSDGRTIVSGSMDNTIKIWRPKK